MIIEYEQSYLKELYDTSKCKNRKYRYDSMVIKKYQKRIDILMAATRIEDLFVFNSLNFESLRGKQNYYSIRIDYHYRLIFRVRKKEAEAVLTICTVVDITNHYQ